MTSLPSLIGNGISQEPILTGAASCGGNMSTQSKTEGLQIIASTANKIQIEHIHLTQQQSPFLSIEDEVNLEAVKNYYATANLHTNRSKRKDWPMLLLANALACHRSSIAKHHELQATAAEQLSNGSFLGQG